MLFSNCGFDRKHRGDVLITTDRWTDRSLPTGEMRESETESVRGSERERKKKDGERFIEKRLVVLI